MQAVSPLIRINGLPLPNPWKYLNDGVEFWSGLVDSASTNIIQTLRRHITSQGDLSSKDITLQQLTGVQWLLYERHIRRSGWRPRVPPVRECWRFRQWSDRHSGNFRHLLSLYQIDWLKRYADLTEETSDRERRRRNQKELEQLLKEIEFHLYQ